MKKKIQVKQKRIYMNKGERDKKKEREKQSTSRGEKRREKNIEFNH